MVGVAVFHLLPHALHELGNDRVDEVSWAMMLGMLIMFFMLRFFHFHQHDSVDLVSEDDDGNSHNYGTDGGGDVSDRTVDFFGQAIFR